MYVQDHIYRLQRTMQDYTGLYRTIQDYTGLHRPIKDDAGLGRAMQNIELLNIDSKNWCRQGPFEFTIKIYFVLG